MEVENLAVPPKEMTAQMSNNNNLNIPGSEPGIDLDKQFIRNKLSTFFMRILGNSMINAGLFPGDIIIVDKSINPVNGKIVVASIDGELLVRRYQRSLNKLVLIPETENLLSISVNEFTDCRICGVVTGLIRDL